MSTGRTLTASEQAQAPLFLAIVVVHRWNHDPRLVEETIAAGARGYLSKVLSGPPRG